MVWGVGVSLQWMREAVDRQQFADVQSMAQAWWLDTAEPAALALWAVADARLGAQDRARQHVRTLAAYAQVLDVDARVDVAAARLMLGECEAAAAELEAVLREAPEHALAMSRLAYARVLQGEGAAAQALYRASLARAPQRWLTWQALISLQLNAGELDAAQHTLDQAHAALCETRPDTAPFTEALWVQPLACLQLTLWAQARDAAPAEAWLDQARRQVHACGDDVGCMDMARSRWVSGVQAYAQALYAQHAAAQADAVLAEALRHLPAQGAWWAMRAEWAQASGQQLRAFVLQQRAVQQAQAEDAIAEAAALLQLAQIAAPGQLSARAEAAQRAHRLLQGVGGAASDDPQTQALLRTAQEVWANLSALAGDAAQAEAGYQQLLLAQAEHPGACLGLGRLALQRGEVARALEAFARVEAVDVYQGLMASMEAHALVGDTAALAKLEARLSQAPVSEAQGAALGLALARAWARCSQYTRAMALAQHANAWLRAQVSYEPQAHRQRCARIRHAFGRALYEHRPDCGLRGAHEPRPIFVVGMRGSGTEQLAQLLATHAEIADAGDAAGVDAVVQALAREQRRVGSSRAYPDCVDDMTPAWAQQWATRVLGDLAPCAKQRKPEARFVIETHAQNFEHIGLIKLLFPQASIISVRRDPRDIAISQYFSDPAFKRGDMAYACDLEWIGQQLADHHRLMHHWHQVFRNQILEVDGDALWQDTEGTVRKIWRHLGVSGPSPVLAPQAGEALLPALRSSWESYADHLGPLIAGTNAKITWDPIEMVTLPEPGWLAQGVEQYQAGDLDGAEYTLKKLLHHVPEHAAGQAVLALIYLRKAHAPEGVALLTQALQRCPWNPDWRSDLVKALTLVGDAEQAEAVRLGRWPERSSSPMGEGLVHQPRSE